MWPQRHTKGVGVEMISILMRFGSSPSPAVLVPLSIVLLLCPAFPLILPETIPAAASVHFGVFQQNFSLQDDCLSSDCCFGSAASGVKAGFVSGQSRSVSSSVRLNKRFHHSSASWSRIWSKDRLHAFIRPAGVGKRCLWMEGTFLRIVSLWWRFWNPAHVFTLVSEYRY